MNRAGTSDVDHLLQYGSAAYDRMMQPWSQVYVPKLMGA